MNTDAIPEGDPTATPEPTHECHAMIHKTVICGQRTWACAVWNRKTGKNFRIAFQDTDSAVEFANHLQDVIGVPWIVEHCPSREKPSKQ